MMKPDDRRFLDILDCWHKTEFFIPFDLSSVAENLGDNQTAFYISRQNPIAPADAVRPENMTFAGGDLYLGTFDKDDVQKLVEQLGEETEFEAFDRQERKDDHWSLTTGPAAANTCFARIKLGASGELQLQSLEVSTLPWAIGNAIDGNLAHLTWQEFESDKLRLAEHLYNFEMRRRAQYGARNDDEVVPLIASDIEPLLNVFCEWANYWPAPELPLGLVRASFKEIKASANETLSTDGLGDNVRADERVVGFCKSDDNASCEQETDEINLLPEIGILNSFYLTDLELAMKQAEAGNLSDTLRDYLTPQGEEDKVHVDTVAGKSQIIEMLQPNRVNLGRWPTDPSRSMSLMQQFSINAAFARLQQSGVFSVNGPPGTGKTTLLRDVIAENLVRRARVLAGFKSAEEAFVSRTKVSIGDENFDIGNLHPDLLGYEMVVASSNNTAVENISRDLPKAESIVLSEGERLRYLQPVAHKLAAEWVDKKGKTHFKSLDALCMPWGLIACTLGNSHNRKIFRERVLGKNLSDDVSPTWSGTERPRTLWQWRNLQDETEARKAFREAQTIFWAIEKQALHRQEELQAFATLYQDAIERRLEKCIVVLEGQVQSARGDLGCADKNVVEMEARLTGMEAELLDLKEVQSQIDRLRPSFLQALFRRSRKREYDQHSRENATVQISLRKEIARVRLQLSDDLNQKQKEAQTQCADFETALTAAKGDLHSRDTRLAEFTKAFPKACLLQTSVEIDRADVQRSGLWHDEVFNTLRSDLFKAAMRLHEAWLAAVMKPKSLKYYQTMRAVSALIGGKQPEDVSHHQALWQNFFMMVPVVSTTFASFSRQFRGLGAGALGWVLIDEAGQAVPQAAVGAMLRAKRALVIGDPLQIEPVLTLAQPLIKALCDLSDQTQDGFYSPGKTSVQALSDAANIYGEVLQTDNKDIWVGSPLRVHRRCLDPMFSIANNVAYNGKMVHALPKPHPGQERPPVTRPSCWINLSGKVSGKQTVAEQVQFAAHMVINCYKGDGRLPHLYLISPFKEIKSAIVRVLASAETWQRQHVGRPQGLQVWLKTHVGTVHTFQGKEEDTVVMVLGADFDHAGAARWAASKPNILNVAMTRAKRRFYMVGDKKLWGELRYFNEAARMLPTVSANEFMFEKKNSGIAYH
ncbi:AAA domain-containing protein [Brucella sp. TWI559]